MVRARALLGTAACAALVLAAAPDARAAGQTIVGYSSSTFTVRSPDGVGPNINRIVVSEDSSNQLHVLDGATGVSVVAESPCFQVSANEAGCPGDPAHRSMLSVTSGAGPDVVQINLPERPLSGVAQIEVFGGGGDDTLFGSAGDDTLEGDSQHAGDGSTVPAATTVFGRDILVGGGGHDTLRGGPSTDYLNGAGLDTTDTGGNTLDGGQGADFLDAGNSLGADHFVGGTGGEEFGTLPRALFDPFNETNPWRGPDLQNSVQPDIRGGDTVSYATRVFTGPGTGVTAKIDGAADSGAAGEGDQIDGDVEALVGTLRDDNLTGSSSQNVLEGGLGVDALSGGSGSDLLRFRDGVADRCSTPGSGDTVDADLADPTPLACKKRELLPFSFAFNSQPVDETIPYITIGSKLRRAGPGRIAVQVKCLRVALKACTGVLSVSRPGQAGGGALARRSYRAAPGHAVRVTLHPGQAAVRHLHATGRARLTSVSHGTSRRGPTTTFVDRAL
jgi:hypothetical protein